MITVKYTKQFCFDNVTSTDEATLKRELALGIVKMLEKAKACDIVLKDAVITFSGRTFRYFLPCPVIGITSGRISIGGNRESVIVDVQLLFWKAALTMGIVAVVFGLTASWLSIEYRVALSLLIYVYFAGLNYWIRSSTFAQLIRKTLVNDIGRLK